VTFQGRVASGNFAKIAGRERFIIVVILRPRDHFALLVGNFGAGRKPDEPKIRIVRVFRCNDPLVVEGAPIPIVHDAVIGVPDFISIIVVAKLGFEPPFHALTQLLDHAQRAGSVSEHDILSFVARVQHPWRQLP